MLIIEDGSIVEDANAFATVEEVQAYCSIRGLEILVDGLLATDAQVEILIVKATDYLAYLEPRFQGKRYQATQDLPFPRDFVTLHGEDISGEIPKVLKQATARLVFDASNQELLGNVARSTQGEIVEEKVGSLEVVYAEIANDPNNQAQFTNALAILDPLFSNGGSCTGGVFNFPVTR